MKGSTNQQKRVETEERDCPRCKKKFQCSKSLIARCEKGDGPGRPWPFPNCQSCRQKRDAYYTMRKDLYDLRRIVDEGKVPSVVTVVFYKNQEFPKGTDREMSLIYMRVLTVIENAEKAGVLAAPRSEAKPVTRKKEERKKPVAQKKPRYTRESLESMNIADVRKVIVKEKIDFRSRSKAPLVSAVLKHVGTGN